jgi:hypothetical protein
MEVTIKLLENAMTAAMREGRTGDGWAEDRGRFLIDGFPRKMDQALKFDETVIPSILSSASISIAIRCAFLPSSFIFLPRSRSCLIDCLSEERPAVERMTMWRVSRNVSVSPTHISTISSVQFMAI